MVKGRVLSKCCPLCFPNQYTRTEERSSDPQPQNPRSHSFDTSIIHTAAMPDWSTVKPVTPEVKHICSEVKSEVENMAKVNFEVYIPVDFIRKNEEGTNYMYVVKVDVGGGQCVHAKIFQAGGGEVSVAKTLYPKTHNDPLKAF